MSALTELYVGNNNIQNIREIFYLKVTIYFHLTLLHPLLTHTHTHTHTYMHTHMHAHTHAHTPDKYILLMNINY